MVGCLICGWYYRGKENTNAGNQFLQKHKEVKYSDLLEVLKHTAERELNDPDEQYPDRLISFSKLKQELERV